MQRMPSNEKNIANNTTMNPEDGKHIIIDDGKVRYTGRLKFFDEIKNFGFIIMDNDGRDIFVHYDDLGKANLPKEF